MLEEIKRLLADRDSIIDNLQRTVDEDQKIKEQAAKHLQEYHSHYVQTTIGHLKATGYIITNGIDDKGRRYLFFDVT